MHGQRAFYSDFFKTASFLGGEPARLYAREPYLQSLGFVKSLDWSGKTVLELGAGSGRLFQALLDLGLVGRAKEYLVVEPTDGLLAIARMVQGNNVRLIRSDLAGLHTQVAPGSVDYFIANGVIPHIGGPLAQIFRSMGRFIAPGGALHVVASYYGQPKRLARLLQRACWALPPLVGPAAWASALAQSICCDLLPSARGAYLRQWIYSFQPDFQGRSRQQREFYGVRPYDIFHGYGEYSQALGDSGFRPDRWFPHPVALRALWRAPGTPEPGLAARLEAVLQGPVAILGTDWSGRWFARHYRGGQYRLVGRCEDLRPGEVVILAYD